MDKYEMEERIGRGTYGVVYKGKDIRTNKAVALKQIVLKKDGVGVPSTTIREICLLKQMQHDNIIRLQDVVVPNDYECIYVVFELLDHDLVEHMKDNSADHRLIKNFLHHILKGVEYCHSRRVLHRDLKPQNVLIDRRNNTVKLADFGLARTFCSTSPTLTQEVVTRWYRAPEILLGEKRYSTPVDMWSVGCIFAEMVNQKALFPGDSDIDELYKIFRILGTPTQETWPGVASLPNYMSANFPIWPSVDLTNCVRTLEPEGINLLSKMLQLDPSKRIDATDALKHEYFRDLEL